MVFLFNFSLKHDIFFEELISHLEFKEKSTKRFFLKFFLFVCNLKCKIFKITAKIYILGGLSKIYRRYARLPNGFVKMRTNRNMLIRLLMQVPRRS